MSEIKRPKTQPRPQSLPQPSPSPEESLAAAPYREAGSFAPAKLNQVALTDLVDQALIKRGVPAPVASEVSGEMMAVVAKAASKVPAWVVYLAITFLGPALLAFYGTWKAIQALPPRVDTLERVQKEQGAQLNRIEALLQGPTSRPRY
jgi:hypothetical protein